MKLKKILMILLAFLFLSGFSGLAHALYLTDTFDPPNIFLDSRYDDLYEAGDSTSGHYNGVQWVADFGDPLNTTEGWLEIFLYDDDRHSGGSNEDILAKWGFTPTTDGITPFFFDDVLPEGEDDRYVRLVAKLDEKNMNYIGDDGKTQFQVILLADNSTVDPHPDNDVIFRKAKVTVKIPDPVPEPTTLLLLGTGLIGLVGVSRKKRLNKI